MRARQAIEQKYYHKGILRTVGTTNKSNTSCLEQALTDLVALPAHPHSIMSTGMKFSCQQYIGGDDDGDLGDNEESSSRA